MARLPVPGSDQGTWGNILNEYLSVVHDSDGSLKDGIISSANLASDAVDVSTLAASNTPSTSQILSYNGSELTWITPVISVAGRTGDVTLTKADVGLSNVDNTSDANKPVSTATQTALDAKLTASNNLSDLASTPTARTNLGLGSAATMTPTSLAADTAFTGTYAKSAQTITRPGRRWMFVGDSITNGSAASNFVYSYSRQACHMVGTLYAASDSIEAGTPSYTSAQVLAGLPAALASNPPGALHIQIGTNDAGSNVSLATFSANIAAIVALGKQAGIPVTIGTVPPRTTAVTSAAIRKSISSYNNWIRLWAPGVGVEIAEVYGALADTTTGDLAAAYADGDGVHPNDRGHQKIAQVVAAAMRRTMTSGLPSLVHAVQTDVNLIANPLMTSAGTTPSSTIGITTSGTAPTLSMVADTSGTLPAGQWAQADLDALASSLYGREAVVNASLWVVGDTVAITGLMQVEDVTGNDAWGTAVAAGTASISLALINQSGSAVATWGDRCAGRVLSTNLYSIGPVFRPYTIAAGTTGLTLRYQVNAPSGLHIKARWGAWGVLNLTALGISGGSAAMTNIDV